MKKQEVQFKDLGQVEYETAWKYQEELLQQNVAVKQELRNLVSAGTGIGAGSSGMNSIPATTNYLLFVESIYKLSG